MSGGFFRGTSADQDTRFSNKQAKLMKSQKFAPELDHLVDISKVKMDVVRPWIATRVTELLGFEDEVLINFIYGLLDGKDINGKEVQIHLTGFMEKNTGKFMKELWTLLLSAQKNASGVPQQFLDAKEEETRKKKAEADRITSEIQRKKEKEVREHEEDKIKKMDGGADISKTTNAGLELTSKFSMPRDSSARPEDEIEGEERNGLRGTKRVSRSPHTADRSPPLHRGTPSRSISKSFSNSRSYSDERHKSRSISRSPQPRGRSISSGKAHASPRKRSFTPRVRGASPRGSLSPSMRKSSYSRRRSRSRSPRRKPHSPVHRRLRSPTRRRLSPDRRRSRSPVRRRSPSPRRRRSPPPLRRRSPSPARHSSPSPVRRRLQSPMRRRSPSPMRRRRRRSPSTPRRRSPAPHRRRSPSPPRRRYPSPPLRRRSPIPDRRRSPLASRRRPPSPSGSSSPSPFRRRSVSPGRRRSPKNLGRSPLQSSRERKRSNEKLSPVRPASQREKVEHALESRKGPDSSSHRHSISLRSPQRDLKDRNDSRKKVPALSPSPDRSPVVSESPPITKKRNRSVDRRLSSPYGESPVRQTRERMVPDASPSPSRKPREQKAPYDSLKPSGEEKSNHAREERDHKHNSLQKKSSHSTTVKHKDSPVKVHQKGEYSPERLTGRHRATNMELRKKDQDIAGGKAHRDDNTDLRKKDQETLSDLASGRVAPHDLAQQKSPTLHKDSLLSERQQREGYKADEKNQLRSSDIKSVKKVHQSKRNDTRDSSSEENDGQRAEVTEKRKHKRSNRKEVSSDDDYSHDSQVEERKQTKRRKKEEKRLRKEERRRRREERRRRREERRAGKLKLKSMDAATPPSDFEKTYNDAYSSDAEHEHAAGRDSRPSDTEETESEQKKLEIELREKALESLRAKKGINS